MTSRPEDRPPQAVRAEGSTGPTAREVFEGLAAEHLQRPRAGRRTMFGRDCLTVDGRNAAFLHEDHLVMKLPPSSATALTEAGLAVPARMGRRVMRSWVAVALPDRGAAERWRGLLAQASAHVGRRP